MQIEQQQRVLVIGATSQIGHFLLPSLVARNFYVSAISRKPKISNDKIRWIQANLPTQQSLLSELNCNISTVFHLAALTLLPSHIAELKKMGVKRLIAFSSTSCFTKADSPSHKDRQVAKNLQCAEAELQNLCEAHGISWTLFRPTLIYSNGLDKNISSIARFIQLFKFFPLIGHGVGLRQPVHAADLAQACVNVMDCPASYNQSYNLSGGETLSYREMVEKIFVALQQKPRFINIPLPLLRAGLILASQIPRYSYLTPEMANRIVHDYCFDSQNAQADFGYSPRSFFPLT